MWLIHRKYPSLLDAAQTLIDTEYYLVRLFENDPEHESKVRI